MAGAITLMQTLRDCLCAEITLSGRDVCACSILPGPQTVADYSGDGQAWVRLVTAYPSTTFPAPDNVGTCASPVAWVLEVGIARCAPVPDAAGSPPSIEDLEAVTEAQIADMDLIRRAIHCCLNDAVNDAYEYVLGQYAPVGSGDVLGGQWLVTVRRV
jgi:hypothetical protein